MGELTTYRYSRLTEIRIDKFIKVKRHTVEREYTKTLFVTAKMGKAEALKIIREGLVVELARSIVNDVTFDNFDNVLSSSNPTTMIARIHIDVIL